MKWEQKEIEFLPIDIIDGDRGVNYPKLNEFFENEHCLFLNTGNVTQSGFDFSKCQFINFEKDEKLRKGKLIRGDIVLTTRGTLGNIGYYSDKTPFENIRINSGMVIIRSKNSNEFNPNFIYYSIRESNFQTQISNARSGSAQPQLPIGTLKKLKLYNPPLPTQRKIAGILSAYDDLIEKNLKRIKLLEEKAMLRYKQIVREEKEQKKIPLAQLATVTSSKRIFLSDYVEQGIPFYRSKEIITKSNFESIEKPLFITEERYSDIKDKFGVPVSGDILITSVGTIGFVHLVNDDDGDFYFKDGNLIWIKNLPHQNLAYFLYFKFRTPEFREMLNSVAIGSSQKALTIETVKKIEIEIPSDDSLIEFSQETKINIKFIYNLQKQNAKLREARDILLPRLMNGEIEV